MFTYNNGRHLPNVVTHTMSGSSTIVETFGYDAAGNRMSMSDSSGATTYQYNQLSQMTSETRTFAGLAGNYTLSYAYNLAGQLKSLTDHTNQRINYVYDNAGRLNSLTGTNYTYGQFINNITYRAWGRPRQIAYGNGRTELITYNARLRAAHYEIPAGGGLLTAVSIDYQYYDDGGLKYSHDLLDNRFDRKYEYDHAARLTKGLSGAEARGEPATDDRPYKETTTYDAFNHLNQHNTAHWSRVQPFGSSDTYSNNRRVGWTYDAQGNWLSGAGRQHTYDAAGRTSTTTWNGGYFNAFYDGDGRHVKAVEPNLVTYYLRSSILGGQVIEELNSSGNKQKTLIYGGQKVIGYDWANGNVSMLHEDPSGLTVRSSVPQVPYVNSFAELDPWGAEVFRSDPYLADPEFTGGRGESGPVYPGFGSVNLGGRGCMLDGVSTLCDFFTRNPEALALFLIEGGKTKVFNLEPGVLGVLLAWIDDAGEKLTKPQTRQNAEFTAADVIVTNTDEDGLGHWELINFGQQSVSEENPKELHGDNNGKDCGIVVTFRPGTTHPSTHLPNGPSTINIRGRANFGLGFSVNGWVAKGGIGTIGNDRQTGKKVPNPNNPKGLWSLEHWTHSWIGENGNTILQTKTFPDLPLDTVGLKVDGNTFGFYDHPGGPPPSAGFRRFDNHLIKVYSGKTVCEVKFHFIQQGNTIRWGRGLL